MDEAALATALKSGKLRGAAIDVFDTEPLAAGSPLAGCPHLVLTPHIAGQTTGAQYETDLAHASTFPRNGSSMQLSCHARRG